MIAIISRAADFSPNSQERDAAIFRQVVLEMAMRGKSITTFDENKIPHELPNLKGVLSMARSQVALKQLAELEKKNIPVYNSPQALLSASRYAFNQWAQAEGCGLKMLRNVRDVSLIAQTIGYPLWVKNDQPYTTHSQDVCFVRTPTELIVALQALSARKVGSFVACQHCEGMLVKFYGVLGSDFFQCFVQEPNTSFSKFGLERNNQQLSLSFSADALRLKAESIAAHSGIFIYGGDAIVTPEGDIKLIDFNDWPSFAPCVCEAAQAIVNLFLHSQTQ